MREVEAGYGSNESIPSGATRPGAAPLRRCSISKVAESSSISWRRCSGSCHGWFATVDPTDQGVVTVTLRNPFTKANPIYLPPLNAHISVYGPSYFEHYVPKVILSTDPTLNPENYVVVALYRCWFELAFIKAGQNSWTYVNPAGTSYGDVIFYKSQLYAVTSFGAIGSLDVHDTGICGLQVGVER
ncbi:hypothetical protein GBA52_002920 [Prunus armeniaca]|nr:hypothetical protein GBA52_002920 [Prunus armeniaca]